MDILDWDYKKFSKSFIPDLIWASPPCNTYSIAVYRLYERDPKTAIPLSDKARHGTQILYKTLEIINYFLKLNPKLIYVIENPRGMMRKDAIMQHLNRTTATYCSYGDIKVKPTDFFNNLTNGLTLLPLNSNKTCKTVPLSDIKKIEDRYSIPPKLVLSILNQMIADYL